jgi:hypothetical protein
LSRNVEFCSGSSTSSSADAGSPWKPPAPSLSTSSSIITAWRVPALRMLWMTLPGSAPM